MSESHCQSVNACQGYCSDFEWSMETNKGTTIIKRLNKCWIELCKFPIETWMPNSEQPLLQGVLLCKCNQFFFLLLLPLNFLSSKPSIFKRNINTHQLGMLCLISFSSFHDGELIEFFASQFTAITLDYYYLECYQTDLHSYM